jgi:hypothetical protein
MLQDPSVDSKSVAVEEPKNKNDPGFDGASTVFPAT